MTRLFKNIRLLNLFKVPVRYKHPAHHWSMIAKKKPSTVKALDHFDEFYESVYGSSWKNIRAALLDERHKYVAIVNNFSDPDRICQELESIGAMNMKQIYDASKKNIEYLSDIEKKQKLVKEIHELDKKLDRIVSEKQMEHSVYPNQFDTPPSLDSKDNDEFNSFKPVKLQSIERNVKVQSDDSRIITPSVGLSASQLYEYIPATKLKGMDDFVLESEHYSYYTKGADFSIQVEKEYTLNFPDNLLIYTFEENNFTKFPRPKTGSTEVLDYYVLDGGSVLPVLALDLQPGDTLLDMCAAPGGKTLTAMQTMNPSLIVSNDIQESRINRINKFINEFLGDADLDKRFFVTQSDARYIVDNDIYNKILVDVPCTTDRHVLHEDDNNIFKNSRIKERLRLPELQTELLLNALKLVRIGGTIVYSTCSLSPIQNDGVVQLALKKAFEQFNIVACVKDQTQALIPLKYLYNIGGFGLRYGHIVYPTKSRNWGPTYFCKIVREQ